MPGEQIRIMCPSLSCRRVLAVPVSSRGKNVRCKGCGATIKVPEKRVAPVAAGPEGAATDDAKGNAGPAAKAA